LLETCSFFIFYSVVNIQSLNRNPWVKSALDFMYPPLCLGCGEFNESVNDICDKCLDAVERYEKPFCLNCQIEVARGHTCPRCGAESFVLFAWGNYIDPLKAIIHQFKFKGITTPADTFAEAITGLFGERIKAQGADYLVPIPLYPSREYQRGYNQSALLAGALSKMLDIEVNGDILVRREKRKPQSRLNEIRRRKNIAGVFAVDEDVNDDNNKQTELILVDDVVTSGATVYEARRVLTEAGYRVPAVVAAAHGL